MLWKISRAFLISVISALFVRPGMTTTYYVDYRGGLDTNIGTSPEQAWKTISKVNSFMGSFLAGDNILFKRGETWTEPLALSCSGSSGSPITFGAYGTGAKPIIDRRNVASTGILCSTPNANHISVQDFEIKNVSANSSGIAFINAHSNITISRCDIHDTHNGIFITKTDTYTIEDCTLYSITHSGIIAYGSPANQIANGTIRGNAVHHVASDGITLHDDDSGYEMGPRHLIENNVVHDCGENNYDITSGSHIIMRGNESYAGGGVGDILWGTSDYGVFEKNHVHDTTDEGLVIGRIANSLIVKNNIFYNCTNYPVMLQSTLGANNVEVCHNTFVNVTSSSRAFVYINSNTFSPVFKNNIFYAAAANTPTNYVVYISPATPENTSSVWDANCFYNAAGDDMSRWKVGSTAYNFASWKLTYGQDANSMWDNPDFVSGSGFQLTSGSPCIDAGAFLTRTRASGSGTTIPVEDAGCFIEGFGMVEGDIIQLQWQTQTARITGVGYADNSISIDRPLSWSSGQGVSLAYRGVAPDIGAYEYENTQTVLASASASPTSGFAPLAVSFTGNATGGSEPYFYRWDFGDGQTSAAQNPVHTYSAAGNFMAMLTVTDALGSSNSQSVAINVTLPPNRLVVSASANPTSGQAPLTVNFVGTANGGTSPYIYNWAFGDGASSSVQNPSHTYLSIGSYDATLAVIDSGSSQATSIVKIMVSSVSSVILSISSETGAPAPGPGGTTDPSPGNHAYSIGSSVLAKSLPDAEFRFSKWGGDVTESSLFNSETSITMDKDKSLVATFCTKCGDVNGDLKITPADAQAAFDIFLRRIANPTWCEKENADVNSSGAKFDPKITPADAQIIFDRYLKRNIATGDCSGNSRLASLSLESTSLSDVSLTIMTIAPTSGEYILVPILVESLSEVAAFGLELAFPSDLMTFARMEREELTANYDQFDANLMPDYETLVESGDMHDPANRLSVLRIGGYKIRPTRQPSSGILLTLVFCATKEIKGERLISIIETYDDIKNASIGEDMVIRSRVREKIVRQKETAEKAPRLRKNE